MNLSVATALIGKNADSLVFKITLFLLSRQQVGTHVGGTSAENAGDDVGAAHPVGLFEIIS